MIDSAYWDIIWGRPYVHYESHHQLFWKLVREHAHGKILDLGCGSASCWKGSVAQVTGIDYSPQAIVEAKKNYPAGRFIVGDIQKVPLKGQYDTIVLCGVVNYYRDLTAIKNELQRLAHRGTTILITINVIQDFPDRTWTTDRIEDEFLSLGQIYIRFYEKIGYFLEIVCTSYTK